MAPSVGLSVVAAKDRASLMLLTLVATEAAAPPGLRGDIVLFDRWRRWRVLVFLSCQRRRARGPEQPPITVEAPKLAGAGFNVTRRLYPGRL